MHKPGLLLLLFPFLFCSRARTQNTIAEDGIRNAFNSYRSSYIQERLYVHTDKSFYVTGEILWFRIYDVDAFYHRPLSISKIAYVELLNRDNRPVLQEKVSLKPGEAGGSFFIPLSIPSGNYRFRAYTRWMKNFNPDYFFEKTISIINPQKLAEDSVLPKTEKYDIQFFPEGGNLVRNMESKVAFRITDAYGKGLDCEGVLVDNNQDTLLRFHPLVMGLGHFMFKPSAGHEYKAILNFSNGKQIIKDLPAAYSGGYVMNLSRTGDKQLTVTVSVSGNPDPAAYTYLFIHTRGSFKKLSGQQIKEGKATFLVNEDELEDGVSHFTVFNFYGQPVCERLYFKYPGKGLQIKVDALPEYATRSKVQLNLSSAEQNGKPVDADLSLAVYRLDSLQSPDETNIGNYLYLTSELGGAIESPAYYFNKDGDSSREDAMDNLMLTQGWRRFTWEDILKKKSEPALLSPEYNGHIVEGRVIDNKTGSAVPDAVAYLSVPSTRTQFRVTTSDSAGYVKFEIPGLYGSQEIIVQTNPNEDSTSHVEIASPFSQQYTKDPLPAFSFPSINSPTLLDQSIHEQVQQIYEGVKLQRFEMPVIDTNFFYVKPDEKYLLDDYTRFLTMEEVLREYVTSVDVIRRRDKFNLIVYDYALKEFFPGEPLILIDGVPLFDPNKLFHQDPLKIRRLDLITRKYFLGYQAFDGIVNCTTYHGDLDGVEMDPHALVLDYPGIPGQREFFAPEYETEQQINSRMPDFRTLLYWSPQMRTGKGGKEQVNFYTSDIPGRYAVVAQGITENGQPGSGIAFFTIKK